MKTPHHVTYHSFTHLWSCSKSRITPETGEICLFYGCLIFLSVEGGKEQSLLLAMSLLENMLDALKNRRNRPCPAPREYQGGTGRLKEHQVHVLKSQLFISDWERMQLGRETCIESSSSDRKQAWCLCGEVYPADSSWYVLDRGVSLQDTSLWCLSAKKAWNRRAVSKLLFPSNASKFWVRIHRKLWCSEGPGSRKQDSRGRKLLAQAPMELLGAEGICLERRWQGLLRSLSLLWQSKQSLFRYLSARKSEKSPAPWASLVSLPWITQFMAYWSQMGTSTSLRTLFVCASLDSSLTLKPDTNTWGFTKPLDSWLRGSLKVKNFCCCLHWLLMFQ